MRFFALLLSFAPFVCLAGASGLSAGYLGRDVCAGCHKEISETQSHTAMAQTWQGAGTKQLPVHYSESYAEGPDPSIVYQVRRTAHRFDYEVKMPGRQAIDFPIETTMGGKRHGISFLFRVPDIGGLKLNRAPLVEGRYLHYAPANRLELSPGFAKEKPATYETAFGRVLSPQFERKCVTCHGQPRTRGTHVDVGVTCESCHGPGQAHLSALAKKSRDLAILNPKKLAAAEQMRPCAQCHSGFSVVQDPLPDDLLISDQVTALKNSECWRQSGGQIACTNCHDPHEDAPRAILVARSENTCLHCHAAGVVNHAGLCPVNRQTGCVGCHMPDAKKSPLLVADHWIRVHPEQHTKSPAVEAAWRSKVMPKHLFLRKIAVGDRGSATAIREQLASGASFFELARSNSVDKSSSINGGFLGDLSANELDPSWAKAALTLLPGEISPVVSSGDQYLILQRLPRNFREEAEARFNKAMELRAEGKRQQSANELLEALKIYPHLLRALTYLGITYGEAGNPQTGEAILRLATTLYPEDAGAHFNLGIAEEALDKTADSIAEYERALAIQSDLAQVYLNLGGALVSSGQLDKATRVYRKGIEVDPLGASLHWSLGVALQREGKVDEANRELALAAKIDPKLIASQSGK